jgi:hypothetical protein
MPFCDFRRVQAYPTYVCHAVTYGGQQVSVTTSPTYTVTIAPPHLQIPTTTHSYPQATTCSAACSHPHPHATACLVARRHLQPAATTSSTTYHQHQPAAPCSATCSATCRAEITFNAAPRADHCNHATPHRHARATPACLPRSATALFPALHERSHSQRSAQWLCRLCMAGGASMASSQLHTAVRFGRIYFESSRGPSARCMQPTTQQGGSLSQASNC